jgi:hypothetical protein
VVEEFSNELKRYRVTTVVGDRYSGEWCRERFRVHSINYQVAGLSKSDLYQALLPMINSRGVDLLDDARLVHHSWALSAAPRAAVRTRSTMAAARTTTWPTPLPAAAI